MATLTSIFDCTKYVQDYWHESDDTAILPNIANFKAEYDANNNRLIHLTWDKAYFEDFSHYEIRCSKAWNLDPKMDNIPYNLVLTDDLTENKLDFLLTDKEKSSAKDVTLWIVAYNNHLKRSQTPTKLELSVLTEPEKVSGVSIKQDENNKKIVCIKWNPVTDPQLDSYILIIQEENMLPVYVSTTDPYWYHRVSHNGKMTVAIKTQLKNGSCTSSPNIKSFKVDIAPNPVENLRAVVNEDNLIINWNEPANDNSSDVEYHYVVTTADRFADEIVREFSITTTATVPLRAPGSYTVAVIPHRHINYLTKDKKRLDEVIEGLKQEITVEVKPTRVFSLS